MKKKITKLFFAVVLASISMLYNFTYAMAENDKKTGEFEFVSFEKISGYAGEPGQGNGQGNTVDHIDIFIYQNGNQIGSPIRVDQFEEVILQGKKRYYFNVDMQSKWPEQFNPAVPFKLIGKVYKQANGNFQYEFTKDNITIDLVNTASLDFEVNPSQRSSVINPETEVAIVDINAKIIPKGILGQNNQRNTPIDVVFIFDTSGSMVLNMATGKSDNQKFIKAKDGAVSAIEKFKEAAIEGDRFAFIPFALNVGTVINFNTNTSKAEITKQLNKIKDTINGLKANGGTNYYDAFTKANELLGNSDKPKYIIFLTDGRPDTYEDYSNVNISGEFPKWEVVTKEVKVKSCILILCTTKTKTEVVSEGWSTKKYSVNNANVKLQKEKNDVIFKFNGEKYLFGKGDLDYAYARVAASHLASKGIKLYSIGFGSDGDVDMNFLSELSNLTGGNAQKGEKADISSIYENLSNTISKASIRNIKVLVSINDYIGKVMINSGAVMDDKNPGYVALNFDDIPYEIGVTPKEPATKSFSLAFYEPGVYTFNDIKLVYTDLKNNSLTVSGEPFDVTIVKNSSIGMKFAADLYEIDVDSNTVPTIDLTEEVLPENEGDVLPEVINWSSSNSNVAVVNNGIVTPKGIGEAQIKIQATDEKGNPIEAATTVKINVVIEEISFDAASYLYDDDKDSMDMLPHVIFKQSAPASFALTGDQKRNALQWGPDLEESKVITMNNGRISRKGQDISGFQMIKATLREPNPNDYYKIKPSTKKETQALIKVNGESKTIQEPKKQW